MAVRTPVYWDGTAFKEMSAVQMTAVKQRCVYLHGHAPGLSPVTRSIDLSYLASNGNLQAMTDTRDRAGAETSNSTRFSNNSPGNTNDAYVEVTRDHLHRLVSTPIGNAAPVDTNNVLFPLYLDGTSGLRSMTMTDMHDTFINDAIELLIDGNDRDGIYKLVVSGGDTSNATQVSSDPVFTDTRFDKSIHGNNGSTTEILPLSDRDQPDDGGTRKWYLYRTDQGTAYGTPSIQLPVHLNTDGTIQEYTSGNFDSILGELLHYRSAYESPYRIKYEITGTGAHPLSISDAANTPVATSGDAITDTTLDSQVRIDDQDNDTYRSQNLPSGSGETETTYELKIYRY